MRLSCRALWLIVFAGIGVVSVVGVGAARAERVQPLLGGWRFHAGAVENGQAIGLDDSGWQRVRLPHDWAIAGPFDAKVDGRTGKLPWRGEGWYRTSVTLKKADAGKRVYLDFDGVMAFPKVYVNGQLAGEWDYGYMSFRVDATPHVRWGDRNVVAVHADTRRHGSRWYPGAGLYRKVRLVVCDPVHVAHWGTCVTTPEVASASAVVRVQNEVVNEADEARPVTVRTSILDPQGWVVAEAAVEQTVAAGTTQPFDQRFPIPNPQVWDVCSPRVYTARVHLEGESGDPHETTFGIRTFAFTPDDGFHLNGRRVQMKGVDLHHGHGPLGAALFRSATERQLRIMKEMGANAVRTSHNPPAPDLLDACDRLGLVVFNEAFDKWGPTADRLDATPFEPFMERQIRNFVRRDRNHPSVVVWSIGNEIGDILANRGGDAPQKVAYAVRQVKRHDATRPVTMGCHVTGAVTGRKHILDALDIQSWNYNRKYALARQRYPDQPSIYSESASAFSTRGYYDLPHPKAKTDYSASHQCTSYDLTAAKWADIPDVDFHRMEQDRYVAGEFVWTGFDYLGEPTPFTQEARSSYFGIVDLCGMPKDRYFLYRSHWRPHAVTVHILPHWNWPDRVGKTVPVYVYTNGDSAELFLNGQTLGRKTKQSIQVERDDLAQGKPAAASTEETDRNNLAAGGNDGDRRTRWCASGGSVPQTWQVDLGDVQPVRGLAILFEKQASGYEFVVEASRNGKQWQPLVAHDAGTTAGRGWTARVDGQARHLRVRFTGLAEGWASFHEFEVFSEPVGGGQNLPAYYQVIDRYRLRWEDVPYQPGELKAVAYKGGERLGEATVRTAGDPAAIRLTPERPEATADGQDLVYVLVEVVDAKGTLCPRDNPMVRFTVNGPATIAGIGNGNPLGLDPFGDAQHPLFFGKAMLILRTEPGKKGTVTITAEADGVTAGRATVRCR